MGLSLKEIDPPLDDITFLSRSNHRVDVLEELACEEQTRRDLRDKTGASQPTLGRILDGFQERGWVSKNGRGYRLTPFGHLVFNEFTDLMDTIETTQKLRELAPLLPLEEMDFDVRLLADADITTPSPTDASAHIRHEEEILKQTERVRFLCNAAQPDSVKTYRDRVVEDGQHLEAVITGDAIDAAGADPEMREYLGDILASDRVTVYRYEGPVSVMLGLLDDIASIVPLDDTGVPCAFIETRNETVREWVSNTLDSYRERAEPLALDDVQQ